jgi:hypothetical protein
MITIILKDEAVQNIIKDKYTQKKIKDEFSCKGCDLKEKDCINIMPAHCILESCIFIKNN